MNLRQNLFDAAHHVAEIWELVAATEHAARDFMAAQHGVRHTERITADLQSQLDWLLRPRFLWAHGAERLPDLKRYMQGIAERIRRIGQSLLPENSNVSTSLNAYIFPGIRPCRNIPETRAGRSTATCWKNTAWPSSRLPSPSRAVSLKSAWEPLLKN